MFARAWRGSGGGRTLAWKVVSVSSLELACFQDSGPHLDGTRGKAAGIEARSRSFKPARASSQVFFCSPFLRGRPVE